MSNTIILEPTPEPERNAQRISVLTLALNLAEAKVNHFDSLRQNQMTIAILIFAGLFGFGLKATDRMSSMATSIALVVLMAIICALDRRLHKLGHGWRSTGKHLLIQIGQAVNNPNSQITFERYRASSEAQAEWFSLQPVLYYLLILGGGISCLVFSNG
jgi:hypothetical protein